MSETTTTTWPDLPFRATEDTRIAPHILVRSAVFSTLDFAGAAPRPTTTEAEPLPLAAMSQYRVAQLDGPRLSQGDAEVFFWLLSRAYRNGAPKGSATVFFKRAEVLTALGRSRGGKTDALLDESLQRLCLAEFNFEVHDKASGQMQRLGRTRLLAKVDRFSNNPHYEYRVTIADGVAALMQNGAAVKLSATVCRELARDPLAQGLHAHFASNKFIYKTKFETLKALMGRGSTKQDSKWLRVLETALAKVSAATTWSQCELAKTGEFAGKVVVRKDATSK